MSRTERDVMRGKRIAVQDRLNVTALHDAATTRHERDLVSQQYEDTLRLNHIYQHYCGPYCLIHDMKRIDRKKYRARVKDALRRGDWHEAMHLRPKDLER